jgi:hypothetical protein
MCAVVWVCNDTLFAWAKWTKTADPNAGGGGSCRAAAPKSEVSQHRPCRHDIIKSSTWVTLRPKSASGIGWKPAHCDSQKSNKTLRKCLAVVFKIESKFCIACGSNTTPTEEFRVHAWPAAPNCATYSAMAICICAVQTGLPAAASSCRFLNGLRLQRDFVLLTADSWCSASSRVLLGSRVVCPGTYRLSAEYDAVEWPSLESGLYDWVVSFRLGRGLARSCCLFKSPWVQTLLPILHAQQLLPVLPAGKLFWRIVLSCPLYSRDSLRKVQPVFVLIYLTFQKVKGCKSIPVAARSKAWACGRSLAGIVGSNPARVMDVYLLWVLCVVR